MNAQPNSPVDTAAAVDDRNPWLGLASFTEETRAYFFGREDEVAELARRVQRKLLTVLFGQSGLGKTSMLRAGLVPRLRAQGYCPVYVRVNYGHDAPEPSEQIKQAIARTATRSGEWTQVGVAAEGESLWEFLHHRDDVLRDETGATLIPLLIFDQFEEIFTLAQTDGFGRARAARFITDLADLVENRPPKSLEARLDADDSMAERFDFARSDYRVLIALREDYLAPLEGLKGAMPSITQNRLRLAPMTGTQALTAVMRPGKGLVSEEVAAAIVRFVAGGAELANAEVEPSLLSLICRELNDARIAQRRDEISLDLLAGSHASILSNFYERALADQPVAVRRIIEDQLLTDDFARAFFGINDGSFIPVTYTFGDVVKTLNAIEPYDWSGFLRQRLDLIGRPAPLDGLRRGGYKLVYTDTPSDDQKAGDAQRKHVNLLFSIGIDVDDSDKAGSVAQVLWDSAAFRAGLTESAQILAINGVAYSADVLQDAIRAAHDTQTPIELIVKTGDRYQITNLDYHAGLRYPHLERDPSSPARLDDILAARP